MRVDVVLIVVLLSSMAHAADLNLQQLREQFRQFTLSSAGQKTDRLSDQLASSTEASANGLADTCAACLPTTCSWCTTPPT